MTLNKGMAKAYIVFPLCAIPQVTQQQLAKTLGMARNTITRYERGFLPKVPKYVELAVKGLLAESRHRRKK